MEGYQQLFALTKNPKYVKMRLPENRAAIRIEQYCKRRKDRMKPKRQEDSSCVFAYYFVAALAAAIPQEKKARRNRFGADQEKKFCKKPSGRYGRKIVKGEASSRPCMPQADCGAGHTGYRAFLIRHRADHRTPAEPSAAEFSGLVSAVAHPSRGQTLHAAAY